MHVHLWSPFVWVLFAFVVVALRHRRRMEAMRLGLRDSGRRFGRRFEPAIDADPSLNAADRKELEDLRERVKVLERIATDANTQDARTTRQLAEEIEALRDR